MSRSYWQKWIILSICLRWHRLCSLGKAYYTGMCLRNLTLLKDCASAYSTNRHLFIHVSIEKVVQLHTQSQNSHVRVEEGILQSLNLDCCAIIVNTTYILNFIKVNGRVMRPSDACRWPRTECHMSRKSCWPGLGAQPRLGWGPGVRCTVLRTKAQAEWGSWPTTLVDH